MESLCSIFCIDQECPVNPDTRFRVDAWSPLGDILFTYVFCALFKTTHDTVNKDVNKFVFLNGNLGLNTKKL